MQESLFVRELDRIETLLQALEYERECELPKATLQEFWDAAESRPFSDLGHRMYHWLKGQRGAHG